MELDQLQTWPYTTTQGETRSAIAQRFGIDETELERLNPGLARQIPYHSGQYAPGSKLLLPVDPAQAQPSQDGAVTRPAPATRKARTARPATQPAPQTPAEPEPLQMARPTDWATIQGSKEWSEATPERRIERLKDHAQSWAQYLYQNGMPEQEALDQSKRFFNAWRLHALDNGVNPGEHATSELITGISDMVLGSIAGPGLMAQASREADRAESINSKRSITPGQQETILKKLATLKTDREKSLYRDELREKHDIVVFDWSPDNVVADYVPGLRESDGSDVGSMVSKALVGIGEGWKGATKSTVEGLLRKNPRLAESFLWGDLPQGVGNALGFLGVGALTGGYGVAAAGSGLQAESAYFTGKQAGASEQDILGQMAPQALIGMSESFGLGGKVKLLKETPFGRWIEHGLQRYIFGGVKETAQELLQNALTDVSEKYGNIDPQRNPFDLEKAARTAGVAFITGSTMTGLERSDSVILLKAQKALNEITIDTATSILDGSHPAIQAVQGVLSREDIGQKERDNASLQLQLWQNNARELLQSATTSNQQVAEMATNLAGDQAQTSAADENQLSPMEKVGLDVENQVNLRDASDEEFTRIWKNEPNADGTKDGLGSDERRRIREALNLPDNAPIAKIRDAFREHTKDVTKEPDLATMALPELIGYHEQLSKDRGEVPSKPLILKTSEELDQMTAANASPEAQQAARSAVGKDVNPEDLQTFGANWIEQVDGVKQASIAIVEGKTSPYTYGREKAQQWLRTAHDDGRFTLDELREARKEIEHFNKEADPHEWTDEGMFEWGSDYAMEYLTGKAPEAKSLPAKVREFFARLGEHLAEVVRRAARLQKALKAGKVSGKFESALAQASGLQTGEAFDPYAGLSHEEAAHLGKMLAAPQSVDTYLASNEVSDATVSAFGESQRRAQQAQRDAGKIKVPATPEVTTATPDGAMMTVGRKFDSPKMTREQLKGHRQALNELESEIRADRAIEATMKPDRRTFSLEDVDKLEKNLVSPKMLNLEPGQESKVLQAAQDRRQKIQVLSSDRVQSINLANKIRSEEQAKIADEVKSKTAEVERLRSEAADLRKQSEEVTARDAKARLRVVTDEAAKLREDAASMGAKREKSLLSEADQLDKLKADLEEQATATALEEDAKVLSRRAREAGDRAEAKRKEAAENGKDARAAKLEKAKEFDAKAKQLAKDQKQIIADNRKPLDEKATELEKKAREIEKTIPTVDKNKYDREAQAAEDELNRLQAQTRLEVNLGDEPRTTLQQRLKLIDQIRTLEAIVGALPQELRGALSGWSKMVRTGSPAKRAAQLGQAADKAWHLLDRHAKAVVGNNIERIISLGEARMKNGKPEGPAGPVVADALAKIKGYMALTSEQADEERIKLEALIEEAKTEAEERKLLEDLLLLNEFGAIEDRSVENLFQIADSLQEMVDTGRLARRMKEEAFRREMKIRREADIKTITGGKGQLPSDELARRRDEFSSQWDKLDEWDKKHLDWEWMMNAADRSDTETAPLQGRLAKYYGELVHTASLAEERDVERKTEEMFEALADIGGIEKKGPMWRLNTVNLWAELDSPVDETGMTRLEIPDELRRVEAFPIDKARLLAKGRVKIAEDGTRLGLKQDQQQKVLEALQAHDEKLAGAGVNVTNEKAELARIESRMPKNPTEADTAELTAAKQRVKDAEKKLRDLNRRKNLKEVDLTDWSKGSQRQLRFSQSQAMAMTMVWGQENQRANLEYWGYSKETMVQAEKFLSDKAKRLRQWILDRYGDTWHEINPVFQDVFGANLPQEPNYAPAPKLSEKETVVDDWTSDIQTRASVYPNFLISRTKNKAEPDFSMGALAQYQRHFVQSSHFVHWAKPMKILRATLGNRKVREAIKQERGENLQKEISRRIDAFANNGDRKAQSVKIVDAIRGRVVVAGLAGNITQLPKQLTGGLAYMNDVPVHKWFTYKLDFLKHPIENFEKMRNLPFVQTRLSGNIDRDLRAVVTGMFGRTKGGRVQKMGKLHYLTQTTGFLSTTLSDAWTVIFDGYAVYKYNYDRAISDARKAGHDVNDPAVIREAERQAELAHAMSTRRTQTDASLMGQSSFEMGGSFQRMYTVFGNNSRKYWQLTSQAFADMRAGRKDATGEFWKKMALAHFVLPVAYQFAVDASKLGLHGLGALLGGDDDRDETVFDPWRYGVACLLGPLKGWWVGGQAIESLLKGLAKQGAQTRGEPVSEYVGKAAESIGDALVDIQKGEFGAEDVLSVTRDIGAAGGFLKGRGALVLPIIRRTMQQMGIGDKAFGRWFESGPEKAARAQDQRWERIKAEAGIIQKAGKPARIEGDVVSKLQAMQDSGEITAGEADTLTESVQRIQQTGAKGLTKAEKKLEGFGVASGARAAAMNRTLRDLPEAARQETMQRWLDVGLLSPTVEDQLATMR